MSLQSKTPPLLDRSFLVELAGGLIYKQAEALFESGAVTLVEWNSPVLEGVVVTAEGRFEPKLNLRSTVFTQNNCNCAEGRRRKMCVHTIAMALHYEALRQEQINSAEFQSAVATEFAEPLPQEPIRPNSIRISDNGEPLRILVFLPPNLKSTSRQDVIVVKLDAAVGREIMPLNQLKQAHNYSVTPPHLAALSMVESWCGGKLASLLQLTVRRLSNLLTALVNEPVVYWVKKPDVPIPWQENQLPGVHEFLPQEREPELLEVSDGTSVATNPEDSVKAVLDTTDSSREAAKPNPRRIAERHARKHWSPGKADYPAANAVSKSMDSFSKDCIVVDGSPNFLAIRLPRNDDSIRPLRECLKSEGFLLEPSNRKWWLRDRHKTLNFLAGHWKELREQWQAEFTENFNTRFAHVKLSSLEIETREDAGRFVLDIRLGKESDEVDLRRAVASGRSYVETNDRNASITLLDKTMMERLHLIERAVSSQADRPFTPTFSKRLDTQDLVDTEELLEELAEGWQPPQAWQSRSRALKQVGSLEAAPVRKGLDLLLRTYQRIGVAWLWHLYRHDLGGILADEMGLGKTLQALALIGCIHVTHSGAKPALVVCPASLVENWLREAERFAPNLNALKHHGTKRAKEPVKLEDADVIITSYGTLRQDIEMLSTLDWSVIIGDEAQHIKNRRSQNARSLSRLKSRGRFLLTGTPVENSLEDLLSLFSFLMPGYLTKATGKLSQEDRAWHSRRQTQRAAAYILRRTKKEVAPELPEKIEKVFFCEFSPKQMRFYQDTLEKTRREIFDMEMAGASTGRVQFAAFKELLRLRQVCADPRILDETFPAADSAKLAAFGELLDECLDAGSRMLVFSSFVSALKLLAQYLQEQGHSFCYLDGQTKNRLALCDRFNEDSSIPVFLISLKAGGTGLNLTGADTVVHFDPWWNPAAEAQASDRAHRIGQEKVVTSIKLIAANTVEEKVLELQARKADILKELFEESEAANSKVSLSDIKNLLV